MPDAQSPLALDIEGQRLWSAWIAMWNGDVDANTIVSADFQIRFAGDLPNTDDIRGPVAFQSFLTASRSRGEKPSFASAGFPIVSSDHSGSPVSGQVGSRWNRHVGDRIEGGMDILAFVNGQVVMAWSVTGKRAWPDESAAGDASRP